MENCFKFALVASLCIVIHFAQASRCPLSEQDQWKEFRNSCYFFSETSTTWQSAKESCEENGSHLVDILSRGENEFIHQRLNTYRYSEDYYIGATDRQHEGYFVWESTRSALGYKNWNVGEPNQHLGTPENCAEIKTDNGKWNDVPCDIVMRFICKRPVSRE
ncbi:C-type lectin domain family 4 member E-like [Pecten maximus]|uniref:C-type lectin domain family 4 member E-like n=1 Tax=Pecten maximus TaxID=6579 RepID=UPI001457EDD1|nr:C-type lectin domain family 4 member E-like [Pecten maximus]